MGSIADGWLHVQYCKGVVTDVALKRNSYIGGIAN